MKKIAMFIAVAAIAVSASARTATTASKALDNTYVGVNAGATTTVKGDNAFSAFTPQFGIRLGKNFTTVFGLALDANANFGFARDNRLWNTGSHQTIVENIDVDLLGTANLMNLFAGYKGAPRDFEIIALGGFGWTKCFGAADTRLNAINSKVALDFAYNFGANKEWQVYVEPSMTFLLEEFNGDGGEYDRGGFKYDLAENKAAFGLKAGVNYKFACSNGAHNFMIETVRDQAEIDGLNAKINDLRGENDGLKSANSAKDAEIANLKKALADCENKPVPEAKPTANLQPTVVFTQGKSVVEKSQLANIDMIAKYMKKNKDAKVKISGYASPEGSKELNQKLSEARATAVKEVLVKKYKIAADRIETEGLGATDKLFDEVEFNRVALFNDTNKK